MYASVLNYILLMVGAFWFYPRLIGCCCNLCCGCCNLMTIFSAFAARNGPFGRGCELNIAPNTYLGNEEWDEQGSTY